MSFHTGQTFTFGEQPSATKWQYIWDNDYALADGTGIEDDAILTRHIADSQIINALIADNIIASNKFLKESTTSVSFASGWSSLSGHTVRATRKGGWVHLFGIATKASSGWSASDVILTLPTGYRMANGIVDTAGYGIMKVATTGAASNAGEINIYAADSGSTPGAISTRNTEETTSKWISLTGVCFPCETY